MKIVKLKIKNYRLVLVFAMIFLYSIFYLPIPTSASTINATPAAGGDTLKNGLVGWWTFDAKNLVTNVKDSSVSGNHGALKFGTSGNVSTSSMSVAGKLGQGLKFDGVDDYVLLDASKAVSKGNSSATLSAWVYLNSVSATSNIYVDLGSGGGFRLGCGITLGALYCGGRAPDAQSYQQWNTNGGLISAKTWYHYVTVIDVPTDSIKFYLNGVLKTNIANGNFTNSAFDATNPNSSKIGFNTGELFNGIMDDLRIYNRALSAAEITQLYNLGTTKINTLSPTTGGDTLKTGLVGYWTFDAKDTPWTSATAATTLDKSGNYATGTLINMRRAIAPVAGKLGQGLKFDGVDDYMGLPITFTTPLTVSFWMKPDSLTRPIQAIMTFGYSGGFGNLAMESAAGQLVAGNNSGQGAANLTNFKAGRWDYVTIVYSSTSSQKIYVNGIDKTVVSTTWYITAEDARIGCRGNGGCQYPFIGSLDDFRVYSRALSAAEVMQLYNLGTTKINTLSPATGGDTLKTGLIGYWSFDAKNMVSSVKDTSGQNNNGSLKFGTLGNISTSSMVTAGKIGQGLKFDGVDDYAVTPSISSVGYTALSFSFWIKTSDISSYPAILDWNQKFCRFNSGTTLHKINCSVDGASTGSATTVANMDDGKWHHIGYTSTANSQIIYVDGVQSGTASETLTVNETMPIGLGRWAYAGPNYLNGSLDDVRVYNRALAPSEVKQLYNLGR